jgi:hypothetical protein
VADLIQYLLILLPMNITLYKPSEAPQQVPPFEHAGNLVKGGSQPMERVAELMGCPVSLIDVQASGPNYVAYSVFDCEGPTNLLGMAEVARLSGVSLDPEEEDEQLCGPILVVALDE